MKNSVLFTLTLLLSLNAFAGNTDIGSSTAGAIDALTHKRAQEVVSHVEALSNNPHSLLAKRLNEVGITGNVGSIQAMEVASEINGHPKDSTEKRNFLVAIGFLSAQHPHFEDGIPDEEVGVYRSNTATFNSLLMSCSLEASAYGAQKTKTSCRLQK